MKLKNIEVIEVNKHFELYVRFGDRFEAVKFKPNESMVQVADGLEKLARNIGKAAGLNYQTPAAKWRENGEKDPHDDRYNCGRANLIMGNLTDDEMANAVYLDPNIGTLTAAKDRIRWLSRELEKAKR